MKIPPQSPPQKHRLIPIPVVADESLAGLLRRHRRALGLTQEELAELSRISARTIAYLEGGKVATPHRNTVARLADALRLTGAQRAAFVDVARARPARLGTAQPTPAIAGLIGQVRELARRRCPAAGTAGGIVVVAVIGTVSLDAEALVVHWPAGPARRGTGAAESAVPPSTTDLVR